MLAWNAVSEENNEEQNADEKQQSYENNDHTDDYDVEQLLKNEDVTTFTVILLSELSS